MKTAESIETIVSQAFAVQDAPAGLCHTCHEQVTARHTVTFGLSRPSVVKDLPPRITISDAYWDQLHSVWNEEQQPRICTKCAGKAIRRQ